MHYFCILKFLYHILHAYVWISTLMHEIGHALAAKILIGGSVQIVLGSDSSRPPKATTFISFRGVDPKQGVCFHNLSSYPLINALASAGGPISGLFFNGVLYLILVGLSKSYNLTSGILGSCLVLGIGTLLTWDAYEQARQFLPFPSSDGKQLCRFLGLSLRWAYGLYFLSFALFVTFLVMSPWYVYQ